MSTAVARRHLTVEEYLELDADEVRYEYLDGRVWALAGAAPPHNLVKDNIRTEFHTRLRPRGAAALRSISASSLSRSGTSTPTWRSCAARPSIPTSRRRRS